MRLADLRGQPWYALIAPIFPVFFLFAHNYQQTSARDVVGPLVVAAAAAAVVFGITLLVARSRHVAGAVTFAACVLFFAYGPVVEPLRDAAPWVRHRWALLAGVGLLAAFTFLATRRREMCRAAARPLNTFASALLGFTVITLAWKAMGRGATEVSVDGRLVRSWRDTASVPSLAATPNVYYVILDGYARNDVLERLYGFDNGEFTSFLERRGFVVVPNSRANYHLTYLSLSSSLNGAYLPDAIRFADEGPAQYDLIHDSGVARFLRKRGYRIVNVGSGWGPTAHLRGADANIGCGAPSEFSDVLLRSTAAWPLLSSPSGFGAFNPYAARLCSLESLARAARLPGPRFVLAHILLPHTPIVFGPNGERLMNHRPLGDAVSWGDRKGYLGQLAFLNRRMMEVLDTLLANDPTNPIIVLQSDHGPASSRGWELPQGTPELIGERMPILNALRLPGATVPPERFITPVNTFGTVFQMFFGAEARPLPNHSWFRLVQVDSLLAP